MIFTKNVPLAIIKPFAQRVTVYPIMLSITAITPPPPYKEQQFATMDANNIEDIEEVKERISETLDEAWELPEAERKKVRTSTKCHK